MDLLEEAVHLLRNLPLSVAAIYLAGTAPFLLVFLFFWVEMGASAFAERELVPGALGLAILFCWMKFSHSLFCLRVQGLLTDEPLLKRGWPAHVRSFFTQAALQPSALFVLPLAVLVVIPFGWVFAFYQNLSVLGSSDDSSIRNTLNRAKKAALLWPGQNHVLLLILSGFAVFVYLNWAMLGFVLPYLLKTLLGVESLFTRNRLVLFNSTYFLAVAALTYLSVDPVVRVVYCLRCFYGESRRSGQDIRVQLRRVAAGVQGAVALVLFLTVANPGASRAEQAPAPVLGEQKIAPVDVDKALQETLHERKFAWRIPRDSEPQLAEHSWLARFFERLGEWLSDSIKKIAEWIRWLIRQLRPSHETTAVSSTGWITTLNAALYVLVAAVAICLAVLLIRAFRERRRKPATIAAQPLAPKPDLADENVGAEMLPEDGWTKLGRELWERGELRLALRAFYLASLAHLAQRNLLTLARFKSNRDYERELRRRAHSFPALLSTFTDNVFTFDRVWYGSHEINAESLREFLNKVESLKAGAS
jgi:hypothetical protein